MGLLQDVWKIATGRAVAVDIEAEVERRVVERLRNVSPSPVRKSAGTEPVNLGEVFPVTSEHLFVGTGWVRRTKQINEPDDPFGEKFDVDNKKEPTVTVNGFKDGWVRYQYGDGRLYNDERERLEKFMRYWQPFDSTLADTLNKLKEL